MSNPQIFLKKVWGFNPREWRALGFSTNSNIKQLIEKHHEDSYVLFMISESSAPQRQDAGKLLALAKYEPKLVDMLNYVSREVKQAKHNYNKKGDFKWPLAVPLTEIWQFTSPPLYRDIFSTNKPEYDKIGQSHAILLKPRDAEKVLALPKKILAA